MNSCFLKNRKNLELCIFLAISFENFIENLIKVIKKAFFREKNIKILSLSGFSPKQ